MVTGREIYEGFPRQPFRPPPGLLAGARPDAVPERQAVVVVGAGPVGLTIAAGLAAHGIAAIVLEPRDCVGYGSRAACISRRSIEIWQRFGVAAPMLEKALPWVSGRSYWHQHEVLEFHMPMDADQKHPPMVNLQQCYIEQFLIDQLAGRPVDLRWQSRLVGLDNQPDGVALRVETPQGEYSLNANYVVAADGARSFCRQALGLKLEGTSYEGRYLIADIRFASSYPTERRAWFDPASNPGSTVLMHRQPDDIWRIDYQLADDEDDVAEQQEDRVRARIDVHLAMLGEDRNYELVLISLYKAHCLTLPRYRHGRVMFAGDAAHLVPIFGVRGLNSGLDDAANLVWKLAAAMQGGGADTLLDSYSEERVFAAQENIRQARKSTLFMTPPSRGYSLLREAALSLAVGHPWARILANPRQTAAICFAAAGCITPDAAGFAAGPPPGATLPELPLRVAGPDGARDAHLLDLLGLGAAVVLLAGDAAAEAAVLARGLSMVVLEPPGFSGTAAGGLRAQAIGAHTIRAQDKLGRAGPVLGLVQPGAGYLVRPDGHVAARWQHFAAARFATAHQRMLGQVP